MQNFLLLVMVAAVFIFGWFIVKRLDYFLANNCQIQDWEPPKKKNILRIGFSNPFVPDGLANVLEQYSKIYTDVSVRIFYGTEDELIKNLLVHKLDIVFLPENIDIPANARYNIKEILLSNTPIMMKYAGAPIEPIASGNIIQNVLWLEETRISFVSYFVECLKREVIVKVPDCG